MVSELDDLDQAIRDLAAEHLGADDVEVVRQLLRPAARLRHAAATAGASRLGGLPILDDQVEWPKQNEVPLSFLALLDLEDLAGLETDLGLPNHGQLNFFYEAREQQAWGFDPADVDAWRVILTDPRGGAPREAPDDALTYQEVPLEAQQVLTAPGWEEAAVGEVFRGDGDAYWAFADGVQMLDSDDATPGHQVGGWPTLVQAPFWLECQLASNGVYASGDSRRSNRAIELASGADRWRLLLQLDTDDTAGWMWGDVGMLYFAMQADHLAKHSFELAWMTFQCG